MADNRWTLEQLKAIELKGRRLLVSAAAGSGKTAVLVERILRRIMDRSDPVDVDRLLVMTFTRAAAAEMKERIRQSLLSALEDENDAEVSLRLREQLAIIDSASIQTIDSFCMNVVRDHTDELDIDPNIRVADESELKLMRADVMQQLLEDCYALADDGFINFVEAYGQGTKGSGIEEMILKAYSFAQVHRDPQKWYEDQLSKGEDYTAYIYETLRPVITAYIPFIERFIELCESDGGPKSYVKALTGDIEFLEAVEGATDYEDMCRILRSYDWPAIGRRGKNDNKELAERISTYRKENYKKRIREWTDQYTREDMSVLAAEDEVVGPFIHTLVTLAREFDQRLKDKKREKNVADFNDIEHMALKVLEEDGDFRLRFDEIYVDEYQDTNDIQEGMIAALDRGRTFMVGDVKQSIYKFRQARPEIFMEKYERFAPVTESGEGTDTLVELSKNFRSRREVLEDTNRLFKRIMVKSLGGVEYTDAVRLNPGADYPEAGDKTYETEMLLVNIGGMEAEDSKNAAEARMIAAKIKELIDPVTGMKLWDGEKKQYRGARLSDMVILLRSSNVAGNIYLDTLLNAGLQAHCETNKGYFDSPEIRTVTAMLMAIDNPRKEIPMAAFLKSPIIGLTDDELVVYKKSRRRLSESTAEKIRAAEEMLDGYRKKSRYLSMDELITEIYDETGYYEYASALPAGQVRRANLDKLRAMAGEYAATGYKGLFNFIRYIENLKTYDTDFGEASVIGEHDEAVRIMSIHKSKGLEFPIVFLANCDKKVNQMDSNEAILMDSFLGIGCVYVNTAERYKKKTVKQMALRLKLRNDTLGEELRVLYVAMTRAKEKLFITGCLKDTDKYLEYMENAANTGEKGPMELSELMSDKGYLHWITASGVGYRYTILDVGDEVSLKDFVDSAVLRKYLGGLCIDEKTAMDYDACFGFCYPGQAEVDLVSKIGISELRRRQIEEEAADGYVPELHMFKEYSNFIKNEEVISGAVRGTIYHEVMEKLDFTNPHIKEVLDEAIRANIPGPGTLVAGTKALVESRPEAKETEGIGTGNPRTKETESDETGKPEVKQTEGVGTGKPEVNETEGAGTGKPEVKQTTGVSKDGPGVISSCDISVSDIEAFTDSEIGRLFAKAQKEGRLHREQQFIMGVPADELRLCDSKELVLIQGIIDAFIENDDDIILIDYKTDRVKSEEELIERYTVQLHYYAMALKKMKRKPVTRSIIWSAALKKAIDLNRAEVRNK